MPPSLLLSVGLPESSAVYAVPHVQARRCAAVTPHGPMSVACQMRFPCKGASLGWRKHIYCAQLDLRTNYEWRADGPSALADCADVWRAQRRSDGTVKVGTGV